MTNRELFEYNQNRKVVQICIATMQEIDDVLKYWVEVMKVGPWRVSTLSDETIQNPAFDGEPMTEPFRYKCAGAQYGNVQIEIVQPLGGKTMADKFLKRVGYGIHHFKEKIADEEFEAFQERMSALGIHQSSAGNIGADKFCVFDTDDLLGFSLEIGNAANFGVYPDPANLSKYPPGTYIYPREDQ